MAFPEEIAARLVAAGVGTVDTDIFYRSASAIPKGNGPYVFILETGGTGFGRTQNDTATEMPTAQVSCRARDAKAARDKLVLAFAALGGANGLYNITLSGVFYLSLKARQGIADIGSDGVGRPVYVFNIDAEKAPS